MIRIAVLGAGRIGRIHGRNAANHPDARLVAVADPHAPSAQELAAATGAEVASLDAGVLQTDDRVVDAGDQVVFGGRLGFRTGMFDISLQYRHDFRDTPDKQNRDYAAARLAISL